MTLNNRQIGRLQESSLHASLKNWFALPGDIVEAPVDGYMIDILHGERLIEIQSGGFWNIRSKLQKLLSAHPLTLIYPVASRKWIVKIGNGGEIESRRKSPRKGRVEDLFKELVAIPQEACHPNFELVVVEIEQEVWQLRGSGGSWRRKGWVIADQRLIGVQGMHKFSQPGDYLDLLPEQLPEIFSNRELADGLGIRDSLAAKMTYCLRNMNLIEITGKRGRSNLHRLLVVR
jgi:hypothetical protein